jgi:Ig-like domain from next to BRCA1 gene
LNSVSGTDQPYRRGLINITLPDLKSCIKYSSSQSISWAIVSEDTEHEGYTFVYNHKDPKGDPSMQSKNNRTAYILLGVVVLVILAGIIASFASRSSTNNRATPTFNMEAIYTSAYQTIAVQQTEQQASISPTITPAPSPSPTTLVASQLPINTLVVASSTSGAVQGCDNSAYVNDVTIPDGTVMTVGQTFTKTWAIQNTGTCTWNTNYKLVFSFGTAMNGTSTAITQSVAPGGQTQISVNLVAPSGLGNYTGNWKMQNAQGQYYGTLLTVVINVVPATATSSMPTSTLITTFTPTSTNTVINTNPPANTNTPTDTVIPTPSTSNP